MAWKKKLTNSLLRHIKGRNPLRTVPKQAKPPIPTKSFLHRRRHVIAGTGLVAGGALADVAAERAFGRKKSGQNEGNVTVVIQRKQITQNIRR